MKIFHPLLFLSIVVVGIFTACSSDSDSGSGPSASYCSTDKLPASSLVFEVADNGCIANQTMSAEEFVQYTVNLGEAGYTPVVAETDGENFNYSYNKIEDGETYTISLAYVLSTGNVVAIYISTDTDIFPSSSSAPSSSSVGLPKTNVCDAAKSVFPNVQWAQTAENTCEGNSEEELSCEDVEDLGFVWDENAEEQYELFYDTYTYSRSYKAKGYVTSLTREIVECDTYHPVFMRDTVALAALGRVLANYMSPNIVPLNYVGAKIGPLDLADGHESGYLPTSLDSIGFITAMQQAGFAELTWIENQWYTSIEDGKNGTTFIHGWGKTLDDYFQIEFETQHPMKFFKK